MTRFLIAFSTILLSDLVRTVFGKVDGKGPLQIEVLTKDTEPPVLISRTYVATPFGNLGSGLPADVSHSSASFSMPGLVHDADYRSSVAVMAGPQDDVSVIFQLFRGIRGGFSAQVMRSVSRGELLQWSLTDLFDGQMPPGETMTVKAILNKPGIVFATLVDNASNDSVVYLGNTPSSSWLVPVVAHTAGMDATLWTSTVTLWNASPEMIKIDLEYLPENRDNSVGGIPADTFHLGGYGTLEMTDVLQTRFGISNGKGALVVNTSKPVTLTSRVWTVVPEGGTAGNGVRSVHLSSLAEGEVVLPGVRMRDGFRTNVGVVTGDAWAAMEFGLRDADGSLLAKEFVDVPPRTLRQLTMNQLFGNRVGRPDPVGSLVVSSGTEFLSYLTVIDGTSQDPVFVSCQ
jgi:hypothetical protein